jgi:hypothetical protein
MISDGILAGRALDAMTGAGAGPSAQSVERFQQSYARANANQDATAASANAPSAASILNPLLGLNTQSMQLAERAGQAAAQNELRPSQLMMLTMRSHEFMFHCELVANVANRSSDGVQQLFRQQS